MAWELTGQLRFTCADIYKTINYSYKPVYQPIKYIYIYIGRSKVVYIINSPKRARYVMDLLPRNNNFSLNVFYPEINFIRNNRQVITIKACFVLAIIISVISTPRYFSSKLIRTLVFQCSMFRIDAVTVFRASARRCSVHVYFRLSGTDLAIILHLSRFSVSHSSQKHCLSKS